MPVTDVFEKIVLGTGFTFTANKTKPSRIYIYIYLDYRHPVDPDSYTVVPTGVADLYPK